MSIVTYPLNGITYDAADAETYLCTRSSGVFSTENCFAATVTGALQITIGTGIAWIHNDQYKGKSVYNNSATALSVSLGNSYNPRIDRVVLEFSTTNNATVLKIIEGTPAATPTAPSIVQTSTQYQLGLYTIYVAKAATTISAANITDTRLDETVCGLMRDNVERIPTAELYAQFMSWFNDVKEYLSAEDTAANSLQLGGHEASYFLPATGTAVNSTQLGGHEASYYMPASGTAVNATKLGGHEASYYAIDADYRINTSTSLPSSGSALSANTIYTPSSNVASYTFRSPGAGKWAHGKFIAGNTSIYFNPATFLNEAPTIVSGYYYEFDVYDNVWAVSIVVS